MRRRGRALRGAATLLACGCSSYVALGREVAEPGSVKAKTAAEGGDTFSGEQDGGSSDASGLHSESFAGEDSWGGDVWIPPSRAPEAEARQEGVAASSGGREGEGGPRRIAKDLKRLLQDLEESDHGGWGSYPQRWGRGRARERSGAQGGRGGGAGTPPPPWPQRRPAAEAAAAAAQQQSQQQQQQQQPPPAELLPHQQQRPSLSPSGAWLPPDAGGGWGAVSTGGDWTDGGGSAAGSEGDFSESGYWRVPSSYDGSPYGAPGYSGAPPLRPPMAPGPPHVGYAYGHGYGGPGMGLGYAPGIMQSSLDVDYSGKMLDYSLALDVDDGAKLLTLSSCAKLGVVAALAMVGAYASVSPRGAAWPLYSALYKRNLLLVAASLAGPAVMTAFVFDARKANINTFVSVFAWAFTWGYLAAFVVEIAIATVYRLAVLALFDHGAFKLCPDVPIIYLPWVLREHAFAMSPIAAFVADFLVYCLGAPIVEEILKVHVARRLKALPPRKRPAAAAASAAAVVEDAQLHPPTAKGRQAAAAAAAAAAAVAAATAEEPTHVHTYLTYVMASSLGLKAADNARRVLMYTRPNHAYKFLFAVLRGFFPLHELCGSLTAMNLARREILGENVSPFRVFLVAVVLHAWANFRGKKPVFKWRSDAPWTELQLQAWIFPEDATLPQLLQRGLASLVWASVLLKVLAHVIKTYWRLNRLHNSRLRQQLAQQGPTQQAARRAAAAAAAANVAAASATTGFRGGGSSSGAKRKASS